jgi:5-methylcytosine-specific restriction protein A
LKVPTEEEFKIELHRMMMHAINDNTGSVDINAGKLHRRVGNYLGPDHRMPVCCAVMRAAFIENHDQIVEEPPRGQGASLTIRYAIPRPDR